MSTPLTPPAGSPAANDPQLQLRRALTALKDLRVRLEEVEGARTQPIAIVGMGCRFPGAESPQEFWRLLRGGEDAITETPADRWDAAALYDPDPDAAGKVMTRWGGFLRDVRGFDPYFFGISPREAEQMDPQQRLLLEVAWETFEDGGQTTEQLSGSKTGVFVGVHSHSTDYFLMQAADTHALDTYSGTGTSHSVLSGRLSYLLDLRGPSIAIDTACSSSLVAVHLAVQSLRTHECDLALAGGVNVMLDPTFTIAASRMRMLAADGRCKPFDARADGFVRGEGCGAVLLKRLSDALADGDSILAVIAGSAVNQDGRSNGLTAPNSLSQQAVLRAALANAHLTPDAVGYIEAHGTGTSLGDPIEVEALAEVFGGEQAQGQVCVLGSAKANVGHLEGAAGIAGLIKAVLTLQNEATPPLPHFRTLNPHIRLDGTPFVIPTTLRPWPAGEGPRYAGISSFGWSGTNAHVIVGEAPRPAPQADAAEPSVWLLPLSARSPEAVRALAYQYRRLLATPDSPALRDLCYTLGQRRTHHDHRIAAVGTTRAELAAALEAAAPNEHAGRGGRVAFIFPGQGAQWQGMGRELLAREPVFRDAIERCDAAIRAETGWSLLERLHAEDGAYLELIDEVQPALFAMQVGLAAVWRAWGIEPDAVAGHSMGEVAAAHVAGALSLEDAVRIICRRSRLLRRVRGQGLMAVVELTREEARAEIVGEEDEIAIAVSNGPRSTVLSGAPSAVEAVVKRLQGRGIFCRLVKVDVASHSPQMDPLLGELSQMLDTVRPQPSATPFYSTVEPGVMTGEALDSRYWVRNLRRPVLFGDAVQQMIADGCTIFIEINPHPLLLPAVEQMLHHTGKEGAALPSLQRMSSESLAMRTSLAALYRLGVSLDWQRIQPEGRHLTALPAYPWQRRTYWLPRLKAGSGRTDAGAEGDPLLGRALPQIAALADACLWQSELDADTLPPPLRETIVDTMALSPAALLSMAFAASAHTTRPPTTASLRLVEMRFARPLLLSGDTARALQVSLLPNGEARTLHMHSRTLPTDGWNEVAAGRVELDRGALSVALDLASLQQACDQPVTLTTPLLGDARRGADEAIARVRPYTGAAAWTEAGTLEAGLHLLRLLGAPEGARISEVAQAARRGDRPTWAYARRTAQSADGITGDLFLLDGEGHIVTALTGIHLRTLDAATLAYLDEERSAGWLYEIDWRAQRRGLPVAPPPPHARWLILADSGGVGEELARLLAARGAAVDLALSGEHFARLADGRYCLDPANVQEMQRFVAETGAPWDVVVHLWSLDLPDGAGSSGDAVMQDQQHSSGSALHLVQALARSRSVHTSRLWFITRGAVAAGTQPEAVHAGQAALWGLGRVVATEYPERWGGLIDLDPSPDRDALSTGARALLDEIMGSDGEDQIALRAGQRTVARLVRMHRVPPPASLQTEGTCLITGGMGGVGLALARKLIEQGVRSIALLGRRSIEAVDQTALRALEQQGARLLYVSGEVGDSASLAAALAAIEQALPPLRGVIHAAGVLDDAVLTGQSWATFERVMRSKVAGAWNLHLQTRALDLDFFVLCSSMSALIGSAGQGNYATANAYLDGLAHARRAAGLPALSVNWGRWGDVGLATEERRAERLAQLGLGAMSPSSAAAALGRLVAEGGGAQATIAAVDWPALLRQLPRAGETSLFREFAGEGTAPTEQAESAQEETLERIRQAAPAAREEQMLEYVTAHVAAVLRIEDLRRIAPEQGFFQLGMDSLMALTLKNRLGQSLGRALPATVAFDYPTATTLTRYLLAELFPDTAPAAATPVAVEEETGAFDQLSREELKRMLDAELDAAAFDTIDQ